MLFEIKHRWSGNVLFSLECGSLKIAMEAAVKSRAVLRDAVLRGAVLRGADLSGAVLRDAVLRDAVLRDADLSGAVLRDADLSGAVLRGADLSDADLSGAVLRGADLSDADLSGAVLRDAVLREAVLRDAKFFPSTVIETGETWETYLNEVVPALLVAGGKSLEAFAVAWNCHSWTNCPMAVAFDVHDLRKVPVLFRPRAEQFVKYFDAKLIPRPSGVPELDPAVSQ